MYATVVNITDITLLTDNAILTNSILYCEVPTTN
jgi:hypothetical protein